MRITAPIAIVSGILCLSNAAFADGLTLLPGGTASVSRGGAVAARPEDGMSLLQNPAGMAFLSGNEVMLDGDVPLDHMCVRPYGYYGWGVYSGDQSEFGNPLKLNNPTHPTIGSTYATTPLPKVCNSGKENGLPQLAATFKVNSRIAIGAGFVTETGVGALQYGGADGTIQTPYGARPTPTRYSMVSQGTEFALDPTIGGAYRIMKELSVGLTLQVLMAKAKSTAVQAEFAGTNPANDWFATLEAKDYFIPALVFSVHARPLEGLNLMAAFHWIDSFNGSATATYDTNTFQRGATSGPIPYTNPPFTISNVTLPFPWELTAGARYSGLLSDQHDKGPGDPMDTELWDVELDSTYYLNKRASEVDVDVGHAVSISARNAGQPPAPTTASVPAFKVDRHLVDSVAVRFGGSYSLFPRLLQIQAGGFFETRGVDPAYADIDTFAFQRIGLGFGAVVRVGHFDLRFGYSHIFSETLDVVPPPNQPLEQAKITDPRSGFDERVGGSFDPIKGRVGGVVLPDPAAPSHGDAVAAKTQSAAAATESYPNRVINAGLYTASFDVISFGAVYHF